MAKPVIHREAHRSFWSGKATALCGQTWKSGGYRTYWFSSVNCPKCKRIIKQHEQAHKQATKERRR